MSKKKDLAVLQKTTMLKKEKIQHQWFILDAAGKTLGRLASEITKILRGKHKADFTSHVDGGDGVIIVNAEKIHLSGNKKAQKLYRYHTGYIGGLREIPFETMMARNPRYIIERTVKGMMPATRLTRKQMTRLRVYAGDQHSMQAQQPQMVNI